MKKIILILLVIIISAAFLSSIYFIKTGKPSSSSSNTSTSAKTDTNTDNDANSRTLYTGYVIINPVSLPDLKNKLDENGCYPMGENMRGGNPCVYRESTSSEGNAKLDIYPNGVGWGPISFSIIGDKLESVKDIPGVPDPEKFKNEVRDDLKKIGNIVEIKEDTWKITEMKYPWDVLY